MVLGYAYPLIFQQWSLSFDEMLVVDFMSQAYDPTNTNDAIIADCSEGLEDISMVKIWHCY